MACCPAHEDKDPSLSIREGDERKVLLNCFAGCHIDDVVAALDLTMADLFAEADEPYSETAKTSSLSTTRSMKLPSPNGTKTEDPIPEGPPTVEKLAADKSVEPEFLRGLGLTDTSKGVRIPYLREDESEARPRLRRALKAGKGSRWGGSKSDPIIPYGLQFLDRMRKLEWTTLVEGESDCWTLWSHVQPALGIPGASMAGKLEADHLEGLDKLYVVRENDSGGNEFVRNVRKRLDELGWDGDAFVISMPEEVNDPNDLYQQAPDQFKEAFIELRRSATPLSEVADRQVHTEKELSDEGGQEDALSSIPEWIYEELPPPLDACLDTFPDRYVKDIVLFGMLPTLGGCMPSVSGDYGDDSYSPHNYGALIGPPGSGKGNLNWARPLAQKVHDKIKEQTKGSVEFGGDSPKYASGFKEFRGLFVPANSSAAALYACIEANDSNGVILEDEINDLSVTLTQDWGDFSTFLRKAFEHENVTSLRKEYTVDIECPHLSVVLGGTPDQAKELFRSAENGLYSRFGILLVPGRGWVSRQPSDRNKIRDEVFEDASIQVKELYTYLAERPDPVDCKMGDSRWSRLNEEGEYRTELIEDEGHDSLLRASGFRSVCIGFRIAMVLAVLRTYGERSELPDKLEIGEVDLEIGLALSSTYLDHALCFAQQLPDPARTPQGMGNILARFEAALPETEYFTRSDAREAGQKIDRSDPTVTKYLRKLISANVIERVEKGRYRWSQG